MKITSQAPAENIFTEESLSKLIYPRTTLFWSIFSLGMFGLGWITWGLATIFSVFMLVIIFFILLFNEHELYFNRFLTTIFIVYMFALPGTIIPMFHAYHKEVRIDESMEMEKYSLMFNDNTNTFVLVVEGRDQPLILYFDHSVTFNRLKAEFLDNKIKPTKRRVKDWTDDEEEIIYELDESVFK